MTAVGLCGVYMFSPCLRAFSPGTLASSHIQRHAISGVKLNCDYKLALGVNVGVNGWQPVKGVPNLLPYDTWDNPCNPELEKNKRLDGLP